MTKNFTRQSLCTFAIATLATFGIANPIVTSAADLQPDAKQPKAVRSVGSESAPAKARYESNVYIVELADNAVATYMGGMAGLDATSIRATGEKKLNTNSVSSKKYAQYLRKQQKDFVSRSEIVLGRSLDVRHEYQHAFNGVAVELQPDEAKALRSMDGVKNVSRERFEVMDTDVGPQWIKADRIWKGAHSQVPASKGEGMVVAVLDSGINHDHPSYADIGGDGYDHTNPLGSGNYVPGSYCDVVDPSFCNDKLIGAWDMTGPADGTSPEDTDGHGSHTAATAAGNYIDNATLFAPTTTFQRDISGVAPHANLIMYDVCIVTCPGSALLAAINQVVIDSGNIPGGIHALNYSISGGGSPYTDAVELGFLNAAAAGIYVSASAGNSGPGASTNGHNGPWVSTTASMTHNRTVVNSVVDMTSDAAPLADIVGVGLTSGYGPAPIINSADLEAAFPGSTLCGLGALGDFNPPWPPGTFNGEIVACTRGVFGRVEKGSNALAAGAGGYILMDNGSGLVGDAHDLPGVHISQADGAVLAAWLAANPNTMGRISGYFLNLDKANGDIMAGSSSRGPNTINVIKPDLGAPGVSIFAAEADGQAPAPEYQFLSGTSMASPHNAGSGALMSAIHPDWTPFEIRSALMMTANRSNTFEEDGMTPTDPFDLGAGRIDLSKAATAGLVLDESPANFLAANPAMGGDPGTLNLASMQNGTCVGTCSWTRTVKNVAKNGQTAQWKLVAKDSNGLELSVDPKNVMSIDYGDTGTITVTADTSLAPAGWNFGSLELKKRGKGQGPDLHMPIAVFAANSSNPDLLSKTVDAATAAKGEPLNYEISIVNGQLAGQINLSDMLPNGLRYVNGSATEVVSNGTTISPFSYGGGQLTWSGMLDVGGLVVEASPAPLGFFSIAGLVAPFGCPSNCDDGAFAVNVPAFTYNGQTYSSVIWSVNGTLEAGTASGLAAGGGNRNMPDPAMPNNLIAPFWTDLDMGANGDGAEWYIGVFNLGPDQFTIYEWNNIPLFGDASNRYTFQIWVQNGTSGNIWFTYGQLGDVSDGTVGVENNLGTLGYSRYFDGTGTAPEVGTDLLVSLQTGGTATLAFQAEIRKCNPGEAIVNRANVTSGSSSDTAIAVTQCVD